MRKEAAETIREGKMFEGGNVSVKLAKVHEDAKIPKYAHAGDSGFDLHAYLPAVKSLVKTDKFNADQYVDHKPVELYPGKFVLIKTGLRFQLPEGFELQVRPRSGLAAKYGIQAHFGTVDEPYRGEIGVVLFNHGEKPFKIEHGDRVAQAVIAPVTRASFTVVDELDATERGEGGFGSSGVKG